MADTRSGRQFFLDQRGFDAREEVRRRRRARTRRLRNPAANRVSHHWNKSQSSGRLRKVSGAAHPWLYQVRTGSRLACLGTAISAHFVLTTASCLVGRGEVQHLQQVNSRAFISLYRVVLHHQWSQGWDLALIQTKTPLHHFICLPSAPLHNQGATGLQVGFKLSKLERQSEQPNLFYQNITFPAQQSSSPDLHKWVKIFGKKSFISFAGQVPGSLLETQTRFGSAALMVGIVSGRISAGSQCSPAPRLVRVDTENVIKWIASVTSENIPVTEVL